MNPSALWPTLASSISDLNGLWKLVKERSRNINIQKRYLDRVRIYPQIIDTVCFHLFFFSYLIIKTVEPLEELIR